MDPLVSLHVCSLHNAPMDPLVSLHVFFLVTTTSVIACGLSSETTHGSTSVIARVLFLVTTTRVILHVCSSHIPPMDPPVSLHVCYFHNPPMDPL